MVQPQSPTLFGMLYVGNTSERHTNLPASARFPIDIYACNAATFLNSCRAAGMAGKVLTNEPATLVARLTALNVAHNAADFVEIAFSRDVPPGIPFRSAHHKFDVFDFLGSDTAPEWSALIDIDCVVLKPFSVTQPGLLAYDLTREMVETYGLGYFQSDFGVLGKPFDHNTRWFGGEFLCGDRESFRRLSAEINRIWGTYLDNLNRLNYIGDELLTSVTLDNLKGQGLVIDPQGGAIIARFWSTETLSRPIPLIALADRAILHLPADKTFLGETARAPFAPAGFLATYTAQIKAQLTKRQLRSLAKSVLKRRRYFAPRLT